MPAELSPQALVLLQALPSASRQTEKGFRPRIISRRELDLIDGGELSGLVSLHLLGEGQTGAVRLPSGDMVVSLLEQVRTADQERDQARAELSWLDSWGGLLHLLDRHWPPELVALCGGPTDPGTRMVSALRNLDAACREVRQVSKLPEVIPPWLDGVLRVVSTLDRLLAAERTTTRLTAALLDEIDARRSTGSKSVEDRAVRRIVCDGNVCGGAPRIEGTRIMVRHLRRSREYVEHLYGLGLTDDEWTQIQAWLASPTGRRECSDLGLGDLEERRLTLAAEAERLRAPLAPAEGVDVDDMLAWAQAWEGAPSSEAHIHGPRRVGMLAREVVRQRAGAAELRLTLAAEAGDRTGAPSPRWFPVWVKTVLRWIRGGEDGPAEVELHRDSRGWYDAASGHPRRYYPTARAAMLAFTPSSG